MRLMKANLVVGIALQWLCLAGCAELPTMKHCQDVSYIRAGSKISVRAECQAPVGGW